MKIVTIGLVLMLSSCAVLSGGMDKAKSKLIEEATDYCSQPYYRRLAMYTLVNGALEAQNIVVTIECPGDEEA